MKVTTVNGVVVAAFSHPSATTNNALRNRVALLVLGVLLVIIGVQFILFGLLAEMVAHTRSDDADVAVRASLPARQSTHPVVGGSVVGPPGS